MFTRQIKNLLSNIEKPKEPLILDVIFEGGAFNGMYELGVCYFLKQLEKKNYIKVNRISGTSIGCIIGVCYLLDLLDEFNTLYSVMREHWHKNLTISILRNLLVDVAKRIKNEDIKKLNDVLFITYNDILSKKQQVISNYKNKDEVIQTIFKSCHIPYISSDEMCEADFFIDGGMPFIFIDRESEKINQNKDILYVNINYFDIFTSSLNVYKETSQDGRILNGILNCYNLFFTKKNNNMCSFISKWKIQQYIMLRLKQLIILALVYAVYIAKYFVSSVHPVLSTFPLYNRLTTILRGFSQDILLKCFK